MSALIPQLLAQEGWDEMHIWVNTQVLDDQKFLAALPDLDARIKLKFIKSQAGKDKDGNDIIVGKKTNNLGDWWPENCTDPDAIYVRFDDDIVFVEQGTVKALVEARLKYPEPYLIFPVIINNAIVAQYLEENSKLKHPQGKSYTPYVFDPLIWSADMCFDIHRQFINQVRLHGIDYFHIPDINFPPKHISINCMTYFGKDIAKWGGDFGINGEEGYITCQIPYWDKRDLMILGSKVVSHLAFHPQRAHWESQSEDQDVDEFIKQIKTFGRVSEELEDKMKFDSIFNKAVNTKINYHNQSLEILEGYRSLHGDLYGIEGYPVTHKTWNWKEIHADIAEWKKSVLTTTKGT
jgi:hypothetical protein